MVAHALLGLGSFLNGFVEGQKDRVERERWQLMNEYYRMIMKNYGWNPATHSFDNVGYGRNGSISPVFGTGTRDFDTRSPVLHEGGGGKGEVSYQEMAKLAANAGFKGDDIAHIVAIAQAESGGNSKAVNAKTGSSGLTQINPNAWGKEMADSALNPQGAFNAAFKVYQQQGWGAWAVDPSSKFFDRNDDMSRFLPEVQRTLAQPTQETVKTEDTKAPPGGYVAKTATGKPQPVDKEGRAIDPSTGKPTAQADVPTEKAATVGQWHPSRGGGFDVPPAPQQPIHGSPAYPPVDKTPTADVGPPDLGEGPGRGFEHGAMDPAQAGAGYPVPPDTRPPWDPNAPMPGAEYPRGVNQLPAGINSGYPDAHSWAVNPPEPVAGLPVGIHSGHPSAGFSLNPPESVTTESHPPSQAYRPEDDPQVAGIPKGPGQKISKKAESKKGEEKKGEAAKAPAKEHAKKEASTIDSPQRGYAMAQPGQRAVGSAQSPLSYDPYWRPNPPTAMQKPQQQAGIAKTPQAPAPAVISRDQFQAQKGPEYAAATAGQRTPIDPGIRAQLNKPDQPATAVGGGGGPQASTEDMQNVLAMMERMTPSSSSGSSSSSGGFDPRALPDDSGAQTSPPQSPQMVATDDRMAAQPGGSSPYGIPRQQDVDFEARKGGVVWKAQTGGAAPFTPMFQGATQGVPSAGFDYMNYITSNPNAPNPLSGNITEQQLEADYNALSPAQQQYANTQTGMRALSTDFYNAATPQYGGANPGNTGGWGSVYQGVGGSPMFSAAQTEATMANQMTPPPWSTTPATAAPPAPPNTTTQTTAPMPASQNAATDAYLSNLNTQNAAAQTQLQTDLQTQQAAGTAAATLANTKSTTAQPYTAPTPQVSTFTSQGNATAGPTAGDQAATISPLSKSYAGFDDGGDVGPAALGPPPGLAGGGQQEIPPYYYNPYTYTASAAPVGKGVSATSVGTVLPSAAVPTYAAKGGPIQRYADGGDVDQGDVTTDSQPQVQEASYDPVIAGDMYRGGMSMPGMGMMGGMGMPMPSISARGTIRLPNLNKQQGFAGVPGIPDPPEYQEGGVYAKPQNAPPAASAITDHNGNPSPDIIQAIQHGMQSLMGMFGLQPNRGMPDPQQKQNQQAFATTTAADLGITPQNVEGVKDTVDPMHHLNDSMRYLAGLGAMYKYYMLHGQEEYAGKVAAGMLMYSRDLAAKYGKEALQALSKGDEQLAAEFVSMGYSAIPNGQIYDMRPDHDGNYSVAAFNMQNQKIWETRIAPEMITAAAVGLRDGAGYWRGLQSSASKYLPGEEKRAQEDDKRIQDFNDQQAIEQGAARLPRSASAPMPGSGGQPQPFKLPGQGAPQIVPAGATDGSPPAGGIPRFPSVPISPLQEVNAGAPRSPSGQGTSQSVTPPPTSDSQLTMRTGMYQTQPSGVQQKEDLSDFPGAPTMQRAQNLSNLPAPDVQPVSETQINAQAVDIQQRTMAAMWNPQGQLVSQGRVWDNPGNLQDYLQGVTDARQRNYITKQWMDYKGQYDKAYQDAFNEAKSSIAGQVIDLRSQQKDQATRAHEDWLEGQKTIAANRADERQKQAATLAHQRDLEKEAINAGKLRSDEETEKLIAGPSGDGNALGNLAKALPNGTFQGTSFTPEMQRGLESIYRSAIRHGNDPEDAANAIMTLAQGQDGSGKEVGAGDTKVYGKRFDIDVPMSDGTTLIIRLPANAAHNLRVINDQFYKAGISKATQEGHDIVTRERSQAASADIARRTQQGLQSGIPRTPQGLPPDVQVYPELIPPR